LSGHSLDQYTIHAGDVIPNFKDPLSYGKFKVGRAYAIEPFATNGEGVVVDLKQAQIFVLRKSRPGFGLTREERELLGVVVDRFKSLPFCERWLRDVISDVGRLRNVIRGLVRKKYLRQYPVLVERKAGLVTQFEETVYISKDGVIVTTNPELYSRR